MDCSKTENSLLSEFHEQRLETGWVLMFSGTVGLEERQESSLSTRPEVL